MTKKSPWRPALGMGLIVGVLLTLVAPGVAFADPPGVTVQTPGATPGPTTTNSELKTRADCPSGSLISGGGINQTIGTGGNSNGLRAIGTVPSADGTTEFLGTPGVVATDVTHWLGIGGTGGAVNPDFSTTPYALCLTSDLINHTQVVMNKAPGPTTASTVNLVVATCPADTVLLGGGARTTPASVGSLKPIASFPTFNDSAHGFGTIAAADGETNPDSWAAAGWNGGGDNGNTTYAYAICSGDGIDVSGVTATVRFSEVPGPTLSTTGQTATIGCGTADGALASGGAAISGGNVTTRDFNQAGPGSPADHLNSSFPSDSNGNPVSDGTTTAASWTAFTHTGGQDSPNTFTDVWALCVNTTPTPVATATTTTLRVIPNPAFQGVPVFLLATVAPANAAGTVQFMDGTTALGAPVRVIGGRAPFVALRLARGTHSLTAVFTPSNPAAFGPSTSPPVPLTVRSIF